MSNFVYKLSEILYLFPFVSKYQITFYNLQLKSEKNQ